MSSRSVIDDQVPGVASHSYLSRNQRKHFKQRTGYRGHDKCNQIFCNVAKNKKREKRRTEHRKYNNNREEREENKEKTSDNYLLPNTDTDYP